MRNLEKALEAAAAALILGETEVALQYLQTVEAKLSRLPRDSMLGVGDQLARLLSLAQAAAEGIADARELILSARTSARNITTYDRRGEASNVRVGRPTLGRF